MRVEKAFPAIVTKAQFDRVNRIMRSRAPKITHPRRVGSTFLLSGLVKCYRCKRASQRVLADRPLAQLHTSQRSEHSGDLPYRNAHSIVEHVGRRHHSSPYPVRAGPVLVRRNIGMPPSDLLTAGPAPTYLHSVPRHMGSGNRRNVGCVDNPHSLMLESASISGAGVLSHRHLYKRLGGFIGRRRLSVAERPHTRLAAGTLGSAASPTLVERSRLPLSCSLELGDLPLQLFLGRRQLRNLPLQLRDQPHELVALKGREVFGLTHSQSIKTCSVPHNPPTDADPANQLPTKLGKLVNLRHLNLAGNQLSGEVPSELGNLSSLASLWLRDNSLKGCVPANLQDHLDPLSTLVGDLPFC